MLPLTLDISQVHLTDDQFYQLCVDNSEMRLERTAKGILLVMPPVGGESGNREFELGLDLGIWNRQSGLGKVFSSSTIFRLPGGGDRSPDIAWVKLSRWEALTSEERAMFPPIAPDFVIELRSRTDSLLTLQEKMQEYIKSGVKLGWLFNPQEQQVEIYQPNQVKVVYPLPKTLTGENILPGFETTITRF
ncbi:MAG: Uma2 family endonuclease [Leptolyngbya sp. SIO3F4]|nr:Uma2 family endonuclease [Leptolyngbya sp. SIO3F4]